MKLVLFDLGDTLESGGVLLPGALETLELIAALPADGQPTTLLGLASDFHMPLQPSDVGVIQQQYYTLLEDLGIRRFFEPVAERVTLSTEVGLFKPAEEVFRAATSKLDPPLEFGDVLFVTENRAHVAAARDLGLTAVHVRGPGQSDGELQSITELVPVVRAFVHGEEPVETLVLDVPSRAQEEVLNRVAGQGATWTRLGDQLVVRSTPAQAEQVLRAVAPGARQVSVPQDRLHLVTQISRLFQEDHPDIRILVDKGRYLVVDFDPAVQPLSGPHASCYRVRPLPADTVVFDQRAPQPGYAAAPAEVSPAAKLSREAFDSDVARLASLATRHSRSTGFLEALEWAGSRLDDLGYALQTQSVAIPGGTSRNLIADRPGKGAERKLVLVTAHLDSVNTQGSTAPAPGADDNASGSAGVLAIAQAMAGHPTTHDLRLILFGGEEQGLFGSLHYVGGLDPTERARISAVVNMDMIACQNTGVPTVLIEGAATSQHLIETLGDLAQAYTSLTVQTSLDPFNSDHVPFIDQGIPAVLTIEGFDSTNDRVHTARDTTDTLNTDLAMEILLMNVLFVAKALE